MFLFVCLFVRDVNDVSQSLFSFHLSLLEGDTILVNKSVGFIMSVFYSKPLLEFSWHSFSAGAL